MNEETSATTPPQFMIYGANGYTGALTARLAVERGLKPILAGRNAEEIEQLAAELDLAYRLFDLEDPGIIDSAVGDVTAILHCAGPFWRTSQPMADACIRNGLHYLDITGEIEVFEALAARYDEAFQAGVMLLPGAGFDVVPTDCLAAHLHRRLPTATHLTLGFQALGGISRGTAKTMVEQMAKGAGGCIRRDEVLTQVPSAWKTREIDFGDGPTFAMTIPWGDVSTAYHSTGIPNIEVYMATPPHLVGAALVGRYIGWVVGLGIVQWLAKKRIDAGPMGPSDEERYGSKSLLWGMVEDADSGERAESLMQTQEGYTLTAQASLAIMERVLAGDAPAGFQTPSSAYGADLVLALDGVSREDL
jgi:short subunit dehydrogenase-like uncharacterized protein